MTNEAFRQFMQNSQWGSEFFHPPYQLACQLGLYCDAEDGYYYPRFDHDITEKEAQEYLEYWMSRYYVPNPYVGRNGFNDIKCPTYVLYELYKYATQHNNCTYKEAYEVVFHEKPTNNNDIVKNYINNYSKVLRFEANGQLLITDVNPNTVFNHMDRDNKKDFFENFSKNDYNDLKGFPLQQNFFNSPTIDKFLPYLTALRTKPFMLLAGISGTGKSRIVRELAKACWKDGDEEYGKNNPRNFCMVQVKPNWHDSTELFGYVSRISGKPEFVAGDFLKFVVKAWEEPNVPYFLCLDEMNLAPVEQYFAEYLSVIESRKLADGIITTDPLFKKPFEDRVYETNIKYGEEIDWYQQLVIQLTSNEELQQQFYKEGITIPQNLFVVGTVNMDETTFSFSRKVLDRAMTIEMNEMDLYGGLEKGASEIGYIGNCVIGTAAEGKDVYAENKELCDQVIAYLEKVNNVLDKTPFKIAYRTRNEFLLYAVNRQLLDNESQLWQTLDEMTSMKILSRIEGDSERTKSVLEGLKVLVEVEINKAIPEPEEGKEKLKSITGTKIEEMLKKLRDSGYTSYWA